MNEDAKFVWNARWLAKSLDADWEADPWLQRVLPLLQPGMTLDVACGNGRNALFLAAHGFAVTAIDVSLEALSLLQREALARGLVVVTRQVDLETDPLLPSGTFDIILDFFYLHRPLIPQLKRLLRPGGLLVLRTFSSAGPFPGGPDNPDFALKPSELLQIFHGWEILAHEEGVEASHKGGALAGIVARRPVL